MKITMISIKKTIVKIMIVFVCLLIVSCNKDFEDKESISSRNLEVALVDFNYVLSSTSLYVQEKGVDYKPMEIAAMTPLRSKQNVALRILNDGDLYMEITDLDDKYSIDIPHQVPPDLSRKVHRSVFFGGMAYFYDRSGKEMASFPLELPSQRELAREIVGLGKKYSPDVVNRIIANMQGELLVQELEEYVKNSKEHGVKVISYDDKYIVLSKPLKNVGNEPDTEAVLIINRKYNRLVASRVYQKNEVLLTNVYGYGPPKAPYITSIKQISNQTLPTGRSVICETRIQIEDLKVKVNI